METLPQLSDFLPLDAVEFHAHGFGYETGTTVVWRAAEWSGSGNPSRIRHGIDVRAYLDGDEVDRTKVETDGPDTPKGQDAIQRLRLSVIAAHGQRYLRPLLDEVARIGDPQHLIGKDSQLRDTFYRRVRDGQHSPDDLALVARVEEKEKELQEARHRSGIVMWRYIAHLYRHGMAADHIALQLGASTENVQRRISSVPTRGAAAITGVQPKTWSGYVARGQAPAPDDHVGSEPVWHLATLLHHIDTQPGRPGRPPKKTT
ncbi:hypothetical protein QIS99_28045 [Streptomyces sp. B-S-A8]|uniref:Uncharacterized protein n=1 Tax=Streptomyces solicavernae TaxID=3043614 RepID=A0ABT6RZZ7_9ACTN|nr:hypothetical protein [Streptomyces sp. B-S-A8]MDI3390014.1 hypothetical protein [Streptomyces sp. B-S-A8]